MPKHTRGHVFLTAEVKEAILARIASGEPLLRICGPGRRPGWPDRQSVYQRLRQEPAFYREYLKARVLGAQALSEEIIEIADGREPPGPEREGLRTTFGRQARGELPVRLTAEQRSVGRDWLRITARRWLAQTMAPARYAGLWSLVIDGEAAAPADGLAGAQGAPMDELAMAARIAAILEAGRRRLVEQGEADVPGGELLAALARGGSGVDASGAD